MKKFILIIKKILQYSVIMCVIYIIISAVILLIIFGLISSKKINSEFKPNYQLNSKWVSDNPDIFFIVTDDGEHKMCLGEFSLNSKIINVYVTFGLGRDCRMFVDDYDAIVSNNFEYDPKTKLFRGDCKFYETKCIVTITETFIDSLHVDDKITFKRVEELPD